MAACEFDLKPVESSSMRLEEIGHYLKLRRWIENPFAVLAFRKHKKPGETLNVPFLDGRQLRLCSGTSDFFIFREVFLGDEYALDRQKPGWDTVVDLGANVGFFSFRVSPLARRIISYEASAENFRQLSANLADCGNAELVHEAVAGEPGVIRLYSPGNPGDHALRSMYSRDDGSQHNYENVPATTLDKLFERHDIERCDLLKIDVEGAEYDILFGASAKTLVAIDSILGEFHDIQSKKPDYNIDGLSAYLKQHGFNFRIVPNRKNPKSGMFFAIS